MAAIDHYDENFQSSNPSLWTSERVEQGRQAIAVFFWTWFYTHQNNKVITISLFKGLVKYPIRVSHLKPLFIQLFGEPIQT